MHPWIHVPTLGFSLRTSHLCLLLAFLICSWHGARQIRALDPTVWHRGWPGFLLLAVTPWLGGHLHFVMNSWRYAVSSPWVLLCPWTGLHAGGAVIALAVAAPPVLRHYALPLGRIADALVGTVGIGIVIGRIGCFAEGCCFGHVCQWPWCVAFPKGAYLYEVHVAQGHIAPDAMHSAPVHPLQLYFAAVGVVLMLVSHWLRPRKQYDGQVALTALVVFSVAAAALELLRADYDGRIYWGPLPQLQWTALLMSLASLAALGAAQTRCRRSHRAPLPEGAEGRRAEPSPGPSLVNRSAVGSKR